MKDGTLISTTICIYAPAIVATTILRRFLPILHERHPELDIRINPPEPIPRSAKIFLGHERSNHSDVIARCIGRLNMRWYRDRSGMMRHFMPAIVAELDPDLISDHHTDQDKSTALWLCVDPKFQMVPGVRQTLDWVESSLHALIWLNDDATLSEPPLSPH